MKVNVTTVLVVIILLLIGVGFIGDNYYKGKVERANIELRKEKIKNDTLTILANGQARKLVADTLTIRQFKHKLDSLQIAFDGKPISITGIRIKPKASAKPIDTIYIGEEEVKVVDYYPKKENFFVEYRNTINTLTGKGNSDWKFTELGLDLLITQNDDGTYEANMVAPDFVTITSLEVQSLPITPLAQDNFGILLGAGYGKDFGTGMNYAEIGGGIRFKKIYIDLEVNTNKQADIGLKFEF